MTKKLQKNIYQCGKRTLVKKVCWDKKQKKQLTFPVESMDDGLKLLETLKKHNYDYKFAISLQEEQRKKHNMKPRKRKKGDMRYIHRQNNKWVIKKEVEKKVLTWNCNGLAEAKKLRDKLESKNWSNLNPDSISKPVKRKQEYTRFEEVEDFPRLHIPKKKDTAKATHFTDIDSLLQSKADEYNITLEDMTKLSLMVGLHQINRLNFIPEWEEA